VPPDLVRLPEAPVRRPLDGPPAPALRRRGRAGGGIGIAPGSSVRRTTGHASFGATHPANRDTADPTPAVPSERRRAAREFQRPMEGATELDGPELGGAIIANTT
jgi:hypothetical protein